MTKARRATPTVMFVDEFAQRYQELFPDVRSFEVFKYLLVGMLSEIKRKTLPAIAKAVGADVQALHHVVASAPWSVHELRKRRLTLLIVSKQCERQDYFLNNDAENGMPA